MYFKILPTLESSVYLAGMPEKIVTMINKLLKKKEACPIWDLNP